MQVNPKYDLARAEFTVEYLQDVAVMSKTSIWGKVRMSSEPAARAGSRVPWGTGSHFRCTKLSWCRRDLPIIAQVMPQGRCDL